MKKLLSIKRYFQITEAIFGIVGFAHLVRLLSGWIVVINGWTVPLWVSIAGVLGAWYLAYNAWALSQKIKN